MFYLTTHSTHWAFNSASDQYQYANPVPTSLLGDKLARNVLFNDALNTFYLRLYGIRHTVKDHSDNDRGNLLPPHGLLFPINSKGSFICTTTPQIG